MSIMNLHKSEIFKLVHTAIYNRQTLPQCIFEMIITNNNNPSQRNTRSANSNILYRQHTISGFNTHNSIAYTAITWWNSLPTNIRVIPSKSLFTKTVRSYLCNQ